MKCWCGCPARYMHDESHGHVFSTVIPGELAEPSELEILLHEKLTKAYQNGLTDVAAKANGVIQNNKHADVIISFMVQDIMAAIKASK
jgi:hypothetical protein